MSNYKLYCTIAAGDGIVFRMMMSTIEEVDGDVTSYFTRKGYYAYGLQVIFLLTCFQLVMFMKQLIFLVFFRPFVIPISILL